MNLWILGFTVLGGIVFYFVEDNRMQFESIWDSVALTVVFIAAIDFLVFRHVPTQGVPGFTLFWTCFGCGSACWLIPWGYCQLFRDKAKAARLPVHKFLLNKIFGQHRND